VDGNSAIVVAQSISIVKCLFAHGAVAETKQERDIRNILTVVEKYLFTKFLKISEIKIVFQPSFIIGASVGDLASANINNYFLLLTPLIFFAFVFFQYLIFNNILY
jgi:uncharacterized membrane protein YoaK (UPF0700 family)